LRLIQLAHISHVLVGLLLLNALIEALSLLSRGGLELTAYYHLLRVNRYLNMLGLIQLLIIIRIRRLPSLRIVSRVGVCRPMTGLPAW
jgi:hypothetical protein